MYLNCKTFFSYRYGTLSTEELVKEGMEAGATSMALTNINNTADWWDFYSFCQEQNIHGVLGAEIRNEDDLLFILLARNNKGLAEINHYLTRHFQEQKIFEVIENWTNNVWVIYTLDKKEPHTLKENELLGVRPSQVNKLFSFNASK